MIRISAPAGGSAAKRLLPWVDCDDFVLIAAMIRVPVGIAATSAAPATALLERSALPAGEGGRVGRRRTRSEHGQRPQHLAYSQGSWRQARDHRHGANPALAPRGMGCHLHVEPLGCMDRSIPAGS